MQKKANFRFYAELNDFLSPNHRFCSFSFSFKRNPAIQQCIQSAGVPHTEVDLILINGVSVGCDHQIQNGDSVSVYPVFESLDISSATKLRAKPLRESRFISDINLGRLSGKLRMLGFDTLYRNDYTDTEILGFSINEHRILLTRNPRILKNQSVTHGYWIRSFHTDEQLTEVLDHFDLYSQIRAFHRCLVCNGMITQVDKETVAARLQPDTISYFHEFYRCSDCERIYWKGSHYEKMTASIAKLFRNKASHLSGRETDEP